MTTDSVWIKGGLLLTVILAATSAHADQVSEAYQKAVFTQSLLGGYIVAPGDRYASGPVLKTAAFTINVDVCFNDVLARLPFLNKIVNGKIHVDTNNADQIRAQYNSVRAEWSARLSEVAALVGNPEDARVSGMASWACSYRVLTTVAECQGFGGGIVARQRSTLFTLRPLARKRWSKDLLLF